MMALMRILIVVTLISNACAGPGLFSLFNDTDEKTNYQWVSSRKEQGDKNPNPAETSTDPTETTPDPGETTPDEVENTTKQVENTTDLVQNNTEQVENTTEQVQNTTEQVEKYQKRRHNPKCRTSTDQVENIPDQVENHTEQFEKYQERRQNPKCITSTEQVENTPDQVENPTKQVENTPDLVENTTEQVENTTEQVENTTELDEKNQERRHIPKCRTLFYRFAYICTITIHYSYHKEISVGNLKDLRKDLSRFLNRRNVRNAVCPCRQGHTTALCPKFVTNFLYNYRHEVICADDWNLDAPLY